jgi:hypothetical protein
MYGLYSFDYYLYSCTRLERLQSTKKKFRVNVSGDYLS